MIVTLLLSIKHLPRLPKYIKFIIIEYTPHAFINVPVLIKNYTVAEIIEAACVHKKLELMPEGFDFLKAKMLTKWGLTTTYNVPPHFSGNFEATEYDDYTCSKNLYKIYGPYVTSNWSSKLHFYEFCKKQQSVEQPFQKICNFTAIRGICKYMKHHGKPPDWGKPKHIIYASYYIGRPVFCDLGDVDKCNSYALAGGHVHLMSAGNVYGWAIFTAARRGHFGTLKKLGLDVDENASWGAGAGGHVEHIIQNKQTILEYYGLLKK